MSEIEIFLEEQYGLKVINIKRIALGVGGDTFLISATQGKYIFKMIETNDMNQPASEPAICNFLLQQGIHVSTFCPNKEGMYVIKYKKLFCHLQKYIEGSVFSMHTAPEWFMNQSSVLLGEIHNVLKEYKPLPIGIGKDFFNYMTIENAKESYKKSLEMALQKGEHRIVEQLECRMKLIENMPAMEFDLDKLTYRNTHGDYTINQAICSSSNIHAIIDWTCSCQHPVIWELTRSFFYAESSCKEGTLDVKKFQKYIDGYSSVAKLSQYDKDNIFKLYYYQLAVCDYYSQYLNADLSQKEEFLMQADFATKVLLNGNIYL